VDLHGANVTIQDDDGSTPLHEASVSGYVDLARLLIEHGADVMAQNTRGMTPLYQASQHGNDDLAQFLAEHNVVEASQEVPELAPLHQSSRWENVVMKRLFLFSFLVFLISFLLHFFF
jgi:ankyrin repeat protein